MREKGLLELLFVLLRVPFPKIKTRTFRLLHFDAGRKLLAEGGQDLPCEAINFSGKDNSLVAKFIIERLFLFFGEAVDDGDSFIQGGES